MLIHIVGLHAPNAPRLQALLGEAYRVQGMPSFPATGEAADVVVTNAVDAAQAASLRCRLLQVPGAGTEQIAADALPPGCTVANVHGHEVPIAEFTIHAILEHVLALWKLPPLLDETAWPAVYAARPIHGEAAGRTVTLVGHGHIGREVARRARALDMRVVAVTRRGQLGPADGVDQSVPVSRLAEVLPRSDILVLCCPLDENTRGLIDAAALARLPRDALLVNVARAEVVDEAALYEALRSGRLGRAVLDVWYRYPKPGQASVAPAQHPLHALPNVRATPHISAMTPGLLARRYAFIAENIKRLAAGLEPLNVVVPPR